MATETDLGKGVSKFVKEIRSLVTGKAKDAISETAARTGAQLIQRRTRAGQSVAEDGGAPYNMKRLSPSYIEFRKTQRLSPWTSPGKSNLTFQGHLLGSLDARRVKPGRWNIILKGTHPRAGIPNSQLAKYVQKARPFMHLSGGEITQIKNAARRTFQELVKKNF